MVNDFINDREGEFPGAFEEFLFAKEQGNLQSLDLSEEAFEYVLERLLDEGGEECEENVLELSGIAFEKFPYSLHLLSRYCDALILSGNPDKSLEILASYEDSYSQVQGFHFLLVRGNVAKGKYRHAREHFYRALECTGDEGETIESSCAIAQDCIDSRNYREAIFYLERGERIRPLPYEYFNDYAFCHDRLDEPEKAAQYYDRYLDKNPFNDTVWFNMGTVQARLKDFDKAIEAFEYSIALNGGNSSSLYNLAVVYMNLQRYREAALTFEEFVKIDADILGRLGLGEAYIRLEKQTEAIEQFELVLADGERVAEGRAGLDTVMAIRACRNGDNEAFKELFMKIFATGTAWLGVVYDMLPHLQNEKWFLEFLENIKKDIN